MVIMKNDTESILLNIRGNGGFNNYNHWSKKEIAEWVKSNFNCSAYIAKRVASYIG